MLEEYTNEEINEALDALHELPDIFYGELLAPAREALVAVLEARQSLA